MNGQKWFSFSTKRFMLKIRLLILFLGFFAMSWAQNNPQYSLYTVNDGLPQSNVTGIIQDKNGFLWIGTDGGLCKFDGYVFKNYKRSATDKTAFNSDRGINFYLDHSKRLWIISYNGISLYNDEKDNFNNLLTVEPANAIITITIFSEKTNNLFGLAWVIMAWWRLIKKRLKLLRLLFLG